MNVLDPLTDAELEQLSQHLRAAAKLLGGGSPFLILRTSDDGHVFVGLPGNDLIDGLRACGGGLGSLAITFESPALVSMAQDIIAIARSARDQQAERKGKLQ